MSTGQEKLQNAVTLPRSDSGLYSGTVTQNACRIRIPVDINGAYVCATVDTGSDVSYVDVVTFMRSNLGYRPDSHRVKTANGTWLNFIGKSVAPVRINSQSTITVELWIRDDQFAEPLLLGRDVIRQINKLQGNLRLTFDGNVRKAGLKVELESVSQTSMSYKHAQRPEVSAKAPLSLDSPGQQTPCVTIMTRIRDAFVAGYWDTASTITLCSSNLANSLKLPIDYHDTPAALAANGTPMEIIGSTWVHNAGRSGSK